MCDEIRELNIDELDIVAGGGKNLLDNIIDAVHGIQDGIRWARENLTWDVQFNTTGRGDNNGCTGNKC